MLSAFANSFRIPELRQRILFTLGLVFICRLISTIPTPGVDAAALQAFIENQMSRGAGGGFLGMFNLFSGGALQKFAIGTLGIMPYISASIIFQLLTAVIPSLERLSREGDVGRQKLTQYTRYATVVLSLFQGFIVSRSLLSPGMLGGFSVVSPTISPFGFVVLTMLTMTTGTLLMMWLGEQITERGIGNGISMIITVNIISRLPNALMSLTNKFKVGEYNLFHAILFTGMFLLVVALVVAITQAVRKIPVQYAKRVVGRKTYGGQHTFMPLRINYSGVMPIIFAQMILMFPMAIFKFLKWDRAINAFNYDAPLYIIVYALTILFFSYFWVATMFNPVQIADDLKKNGGYIPGIRPGQATAEYLDKTMSRITLAGAVFLMLIAVLPTMLANSLGLDPLVASFFGGTSLLIMVGVMLDTMRQVESHLLMRHYDGFLKKGKLRSRR